jgi:hypothetical protein
VGPPYGILTGFPAQCYQVKLPAKVNMISQCQTVPLCTGALSAWELVSVFFLCFTFSQFKFKYLFVCVCMCVCVQEGGKGKLCGPIMNGKPQAYILLCVAIAAFLITDLILHLPPWPGGVFSCSKAFRSFFWLYVGSSRTIEDIPLAPSFLL